MPAKDNARLYGSFSLFAPIAPPSRTSTATISVPHRNIYAASKSVRRQDRTDGPATPLRPAAALALIVNVVGKKNIWRMAVDLVMVEQVGQARWTRMPCSS
jgi:hypothetical protein